MPETGLPQIAPAEAIAFFRRKGFAIAFSWKDVWQEENVAAFTVAKAMSVSLLEDIRAAVDKALANGETLEQFAKDLRPRLAAQGWWGRKRMVDPQTGEEKIVQLGSPARLRTIYQTNLRTAYMAGRWQRIERSAAMFPFIRYVSVMDGRERPQHHAWHGTILPVGHPWWDTHFPPCGWGCRCDGQPVNQRLIDRRGWVVGEPQAFPSRDYVNGRTGEITRLERGIDPGWAYNVGRAPLDGMAPGLRVNGIEGDGAALNSAFSDGDFKVVRAFFAPFELATRAAALKGMVWKDAAGWPIVISLGLLRGANGQIMQVPPHLARTIGTAARVLRKPDRIGLVWVRGLDGRMMLVRRYSSAEGVVDVGGSFWRWAVGAQPRLPRGRLIWTAEEGAINAYDPHQPRFGKGSRDGGRFRSTGRGAALSSLKAGGAVPFKAAMLGAVSPAAAQRAKAQGVDIEGKMVRLEHSHGKHILERHGAGNEARKGQRPVRPEDIVNAHQVINQAHSFKLSDRKGRRGAPVYEITAHIGGETHHVFAEEAGKRNLAVVTMYVKN